MRNTNENERILAYTMAQKLTEQDLTHVAGGSSYGTGHCDPGDICDVGFDIG